MRGSTKAGGANPAADRRDGVVVVTEPDDIEGERPGEEPAQDRGSHAHAPGRLRPLGRQRHWLASGCELRLKRTAARQPNPEDENHNHPGQRDDGIAKPSTRAAPGSCEPANSARPESKR